MSKRSDRLLLADIAEAVTKILRYTHGYTQAQFDADDRTVDAVVRNFEIIGEAANHISEELKDEFQEMDWFKLRGFRNRIVHHYFGIDYGIIWQLIELQIPQMEKQIGAILKNKGWEDN